MSRIVDSVGDIRCKSPLLSRLEGGQRGLREWRREQVFRGGGCELEDGVGIREGGRGGAGP